MEQHCRYCGREIENRGDAGPGHRPYWVHVAYGGAVCMNASADGWFSPDPMATLAEPEEA